ncbi:MAG: DUF1800 domain-containing protein [Acidobacteriota bacterium]|nr:DUF1800 domain-containing protein [Acidobacteriota bacterium]
MIAQKLFRPTEARRFFAVALSVILLAGSFISASAQTIARKTSPSSAGPAVWAGDLAPIAARDWSYDRAAHLLERAGFGGTPEEIERLAKMTPQAAVNYLVDYEAVDASSLPKFEESGIYPNGYKFKDLGAAAREAFATGKAFGIPARQAGALPLQPAINEFYTLLWSDFGEIRRASQWWAERMLITPRPFQEKMTLFWHGHFATSQEKVHRHQKMLGQIETLRQKANGNFRDILTAIAQDPAMLVWLDNKDNVKGKPNENFAREVMELFAMGEGQGYTERDIREIARAFTGWTMTKDDTVTDEGKFIDDPTKHDDGTKTFLGETGNFNGYQAIDIILKQPATSSFISKKIYRYFVREETAPELNDKLAKLLVDSKYDLKPLLKAIFLSRDFYSEPSYATQVKSPVHLLVSTYRKMGLKTIPGIPDFNETTASLGQYLMLPPNVAGWTGGKTWINPATLLQRGNFVETLLFPDTRKYIAPDKEIAEGYRRIPLMFPEYKITPSVWNQVTQKMEAVSMQVYDYYMTGMTLPAAKQFAIEQGEKSITADAPLSPGKEAPKSRMTVVANGENYNLAVGVYMGAVRANERVKPIARTLAEVDFTRMVRDAKVQTVEATVDYFSKRFLRAPLNDERRAAVLAFLKGELKSDQVNYSVTGLEQALRRTVHLILSAPEYQLG